MGNLGSTPEMRVKNNSRFGNQSTQMFPLWFGFEEKQNRCNIILDSFETHSPEI